jgi:hypothetical protein
MFRQLNLLDMNSNLITVTNIPIYETPLFVLSKGMSNSVNYYTPAVQRVLQLAANIYDATGNRTINNINYPSVFRPIFNSSADGVVSIGGFVEVNNGIGGDAFLPYLQVTNFAKSSQSDNKIVNIYGVPWIIGAKKGMPNFNEMSMANPLYVQRLLAFTNAGTFGIGPPSWNTNQIIDFAITNQFGVEAWNSYTNAYPRPLQLIVSNEVTLQVSNEFGVNFIDVQNLPFGNNLTFPSGWPAWSGNPNAKDNSFQIPLLVSSNFVNGIYLTHAPWIVPLAPPQWSSTAVPHFWMSLNFNFRFVLIDTAADRVIDFVNVSTANAQPPLQPIDVDYWLAGGSPGLGAMDQTVENDIWETNLLNGTPRGILNQIDVGLGNVPGYQNWPDVNKGKEETAFRNRLNNWITNTFQDPYPARATVWQLVSWQANDPLVHYTVADLASTNGLGINYNRITNTYPTQNPPTEAGLPNLGQLNVEYQPWGGNPRNPNNPKYDFNYQVKDPLVFQSDNWDFPTNKFWDIGILGRVHRGTPWQTVCLKPGFGLKTNDWGIWANNPVAYTNFYPNGAYTNYDVMISHPGRDYRLFDVFTAAPNENASRGQLNVNQSGLAAWSAVLSGVNALANTPGQVPVTIAPAGTYDPNNPTPLARIWQGISFARTNLDTNRGPVFRNGVFQHMGDILNAPQLTVASPFLNTNGLATATGGITDEMLERIPQQIMSLLTLNQNPRFVIYSFGQTLHPANNSLVVGGTFNGLCTNYQITAETATRAVVRVDGSPDPKYTVNNPDTQGRYYPPRIVVEQFNVLGPN